MLSHLNFLFKIFLNERGIRLFFFGVIVSIGFSLSIILSTIGLMDGFEASMYKVLRHVNADISLFSRKGFLKLDEMAVKFKKYEGRSLAVTRVESYLIKDSKNKGVLIHGFDSSVASELSFFPYSNLVLKENEVAVGDELSRELNLKEGDQAVLMIKNFYEDGIGAPKLISVKVKTVIDHGLYKADQRFVYLDRRKLNQYLHLDDNVSNTFFINIDNAQEDFKDIILQTKDKLQEEHKDLVFKTFWTDFDILLNAVQVEKISILFILQIIVVVSLFNIFTFIIMVTDRKRKEVFLLRTFGLTFKNLRKYWILLTLCIWLFACCLSLGLLFVFKEGILKLPFLKIPSSIYHLDQIDVALSMMDISGVFILALIWISLLSLFVLRKISHSNPRAAIVGEYN